MKRSGAVDGLRDGGEGERTGRWALRLWKFKFKNIDYIL